MKDEDRQCQEIAEEIATLRLKLVQLDNYLGIFDCIIAGLNEIETWMVSEHFPSRKIHS